MEITFIGVTAAKNNKVEKVGEDIAEEEAQHTTIKMNIIKKKPEQNNSY